MNNITKELREFAQTFSNPTQRDELTSIADRIDRLCEEAVYEAHNGCAGEWFDVCDNVLDEHDLMRLPRDAAGKAWPIGDQVDSTDRVSGVMLL